MVARVVSGCCLHPDCFTCPLPDCLYQSRRGQQWQATHSRIMALVGQGTSRVKISRDLGVAERTVYRHLKHKEVA